MRSTVKRYAFDAAILSTVALLVIAAACAGSGGGETTVIEENGITIDNLIVNENAFLSGDLTIAGLVDGVDVGSHRHSGGTGDGPVLDGDNCLKDENLNLGTGGITSTKTVAKHIVIPSSNLGLPPTDPPTVDTYGICSVLEFTVDTDKAYYKFHVPDDWVPGTDILVHAHWTRSSTGSDDSGKTVKWQMKYLAVDGQSENVHTGESTLSVQDEYDSASTTDQIAYQTDAVTVPAPSMGDCIVVELMAITPTGTALSDPACAALGITYTAYQVQP